MHLSSWCLYRRWRHHEVWVKQDKIEPVCLDKTVWRLSFYLSLCIEIINLSMSNLLSWWSQQLLRMSLNLFSVRWAGQRQPAPCKASSGEEFGLGYKIDPWSCMNTWSAPANFYKQSCIENADLLKGNYMALICLDVCNGSFSLQQRQVCRVLSPCSETGVPLPWSSMIIFAVTSTIHINSCILWNETLKPAIRKKNNQPAT